MANRTDIALDSCQKPSKAANQDAGDWVYKQIFDAILEQRLTPGTKLGEESLSEIFDVSRPVVRWALTKLAHENVVEIKPHRGAFIASPTVEQAHQVFEARCVVEEAVVRSCVKAASQADLTELRRHVETEKESSSKGQRVRWIRLSGDFHLVLARIAGNDVLQHFLRDLVAQTSLIIGLYGNASNSICCDGPHEQIVEAIAAGSVSDAVRIMMEHLHECESALHIQEEQVEKDLKAIFSDVRRI